MSISWFWFATGKNRILKYLGPDGGATMTTLMQAEAGTCYESPLNRWVGDAKRLTNKQNKQQPVKEIWDRVRPPPFWTFSQI